MLNYVKTAIFAQFNDTANQKTDYPNWIQPKVKALLNPKKNKIAAYSLLSKL